MNETKAGGELPKAKAASFFSAANRVKKKNKVFTRTQDYYPFACRLEKEYAHVLNCLAIAWKYEPREFKIEIDGEIRHYIPDFYLPETDEWIEVTYSRNSKLKNKKIDAFFRDYPALNFREIFESDVKELINLAETKRALA